MPRTLKAGGKNSPLPPAFTKLIFSLFWSQSFHVLLLISFSLVVSHEAKAEVAL